MIVVAMVMMVMMMVVSFPSVVDVTMVILGAMMTVQICTPSMTVIMISMMTTNDDDDDDPLTIMMMTRMVMMTMMMIRLNKISCLPIHESGRGQLSREGGW